MHRIPAALLPSRLFRRRKNGSSAGAYGVCVLKKLLGSEACYWLLFVNAFTGCHNTTKHVVVNKNKMFMNVEQDNSSLRVRGGLYSSSHRRGHHCGNGFESFYYDVQRKVWDLNKLSFNQGKATNVDTYTKFVRNQSDCRVRESQQYMTETVRLHSQQIKS